VRNVSAKWFLTTTLVISSVLFAAAQLFLQATKHSLQMYDNKYPPNIYHLSYGIAFLVIFYLAAKKGLFSFAPIQKTIHFFSVNSYPIFFIHVLVIFVLTVFMKFHFTWISFFFVVTGITVVIQMILNKMFLLFSPKKI